MDRKIGEDAENPYDREWNGDWYPDDGCWAAVLVMVYGLLLGCGAIVVWVLF